MTWWFKARRIGPVLVPGLAVCLLLLALAHNWVIELPGLLSGSHNQIFLLYLLPVLPLSALHLALTSRLTEAESTARRPLHLYDTALICCTVAVMTLGGVFIGLTSNSPEAWAFGRNALFMTGLMLLAHRVRADAAVVAPAGWVFVVMFLGFDRFRRPCFWAVLPHPPGHLFSLALATLVFAGGLAAFFSLRRTQQGT
ncbi:hypothetical protein [Streptomyces sp. NPDC001985]|uniref:hypothetical protein n=1 Tax=Streptomyces sp. NPDC001985 TaxID=3154406 RepID=UPI003322D0F4